MNIKSNFAALGREYECDYRTTKVKYYEKLNKKSMELVKIYIIDDYKDLILNKLETIPEITAYSIFHLLSC